MQCVNGVNLNHVASPQIIVLKITFCVKIINRGMLSCVLGMKSRVIGNGMYGKALIF